MHGIVSISYNIICGFSVKEKKTICGGRGKREVKGKDIEKENKKYIDFFQSFFHLF